MQKNPGLLMALGALFTGASAGAPVQAPTLSPYSPSHRKLRRSAPNATRKQRAAQAEKRAAAEASSRTQRDRALRLAIGPAEREAAHEAHFRVIFPARFRA